MNIYQVVSEVLTEHYNSWAVDPPETYCIAELVAAEKHSQAGYLAWKNDKDSFSYDITERPLMKINVVKKDVDGPARIVTQEPECQQLWKE